jgi:hypothetical protein
VALALLGLLAGAWGTGVFAARPADGAERPAGAQGAAPARLAPVLERGNGLLSPTPTVTDTPVPVNTATPRPSNTPGGPGSTPTPTGTPGSCRADFRDVPVEHWAYGYIQWIYCNGIVRGYICGTGCQEFRPDANTTRAQIAKMLTIGFALPLVTPTAPTFVDVPASDWAYSYVEASAAAGVFTGYPCGGPNEPCPGRYFRPRNDVTRAQLAKTVDLAARWTLVSPGTPTFTDVGPADWFYSYVETAYQYEVVGGYDCLALTPEPTPTTNCREFRPNFPASRAQIANMVYIAITPPPHHFLP